jgi:hypothetical protein
MATNFMNLTLPTVSVTLGPEWATEVNAAIEVIDEHDHSSGKGKQVPTSGLNINANLDFQENAAFNLLKVSLISNDTTLTGSSNANSLYSVSGNLYFTNSSGNAVQITNGGSIITNPGSLQTVEIQGITGDVVVSPSDTFVLLNVDTSAARNITLPLASAVSSGRVYIVKDSTGSANTNNITITAAGSDTIDGGATFVYNSNLGSFWVVGDGASSWVVI